MKGEIMSVGKQIMYMKTLNGIAWICTGIFELFDNVPCNILTIISLACSVFLLLKVRFSEKENEDEMADRNMMGARSITLMQMHIIFVVAVVFLEIFLKFPVSQRINWSELIVPGFFITLGIEDLLVGIHFKEFEE